MAKPQPTRIEVSEDVWEILEAERHLNEAMRLLMMSVDMDTRCEGAGSTLTLRSAVAAMGKAKKSVESAIRKRERYVASLKASRGSWRK
jgi:hypothetical protein